MIDYHKIMEAVREYREGKAIKRQITQLSCNSLAKKFGRAHCTIRAIGRGESPTCVPADERRLIGACIRERESLKEIYKSKTRNALAKKYRITGNTLMAEMESIDG